MAKILYELVRHQRTDFRKEIDWMVSAINATIKFTQSKCQHDWIIIIFDEKISIYSPNGSNYTLTHNGKKIADREIVGGLVYWMMESTNVFEKTME